jgi:phosphate transport system substrate-binding protein
MGGSDSTTPHASRPAGGRAVFLLCVAVLLPACRGKDSGGRSEAPPCRPETDRPPGLVVAGSGSCLPLVREIARRYRDHDPGTTVSVPDSIGTSGAIRALVDGAIDVGLASRPLTKTERAGGIVATPLARSIFAVVVHDGTPVKSLTQAELVDIYAGHRTAWSDGTPIVPLLREAGDSGDPVLAASFPDLAAAVQEARRAERWIVCYTDQEMRDALLAKEGAVGFLDLGIIALEHLALSPVAIDEIAPTPENALSGRYRALKELSLLTRGEPVGEAAAFAAFTRSAAAADILVDGSYLPPATGGD